MLSVLISISVFIFENNFGDGMFFVLFALNLIVCYHIYDLESLPIHDEYLFLLWHGTV